MFFKLRSQSLLKTKLLLNYYKKIIDNIEYLSINENKNKKTSQMWWIEYGQLRWTPHHLTKQQMEEQEAQRW
jgi:hypothetical protein